MASAFSLLSEDHFMCSICMDVFTDPISTPCGHNYCKACITNYWDAKDVCKCPLCNRTCFKNQEFFVNKAFSEMADRFRTHKLKEEYKAKTEAEVRPMIQERLMKIQEVKRSVELSRRDADTVIADCIQHVFTALISCIERSQAELISVIEEKQKTTEKEAEGFIKVLQQEVTQLENRSSELKQEHLHQLLQNFKSNKSPLLTKNWTKSNVRQYQSSHVGTVRTAMSQLEKTLGQEMKKMCNVELDMVREYGVTVILNLHTANWDLILSGDGKEVARGNDVNNLAGNTERSTSYANVLGNEGFSGSFYYEVQVTGKSQWKLGVVRESINRKVPIELSPNNGCWTISLSNGKDYVAAAADRDVYLPVKEKVQKVGVFVDYEEGTVSFYDVDTRVHLYSFTGCTFTEKLFPFFDPGRARRNHAPLIICPMPQIWHLGALGELFIAGRLVVPAGRLVVPMTSLKN